MKKSGVTVTLAAIIIGCIGIVVTGQSLFLLAIAPVALAPLLVSLGCALGMTERSSQRTLSIGSLLYFAWMTFVVVSVFLIDPDPLAPIALVFAPFYSLPIMILIWIAATVQQYSYETTTVTPPIEPRS